MLILEGSDSGRSVSWEAHRTWPNEQQLADRLFQSSRFGKIVIADGVRLKSRPEGCAELSWLWKPNCTIGRVQSLLLARFGGLMQSWTTNL